MSSSGSGVGGARRPLAPLERSASSSGALRRGHKSVSQREFLRGCALPALVRLTDGERSGQVAGPMDLSRPVLLYRVYHTVKIHARSLRRTQTGALEEVGPAIVIPDGYRGWFSLMSDDGKTAPFYSSIEEVAAARLAVFLCRNDVPAYVMSDHEDGMVYRKVTVGAGNVLRLLGVFRDLNTSPIASPAVNYAQCVNYKNEVVFVPFTAEGRFYAAASRPTDSADHAFLMSQLLRQKPTPRTVKLVCGFMPRIDCSFTGMLRLDEVRPERLVLGCTTDTDTPPTLFELDADSSLRVQPVDQLDRHASPAFTRALVTCERHGDLWRHQMKVSHDVLDAAPAPRPPSLSGRPAPAEHQLRLCKSSSSLEAERRPARSLRQTVSRFFLNRGRGNRDVTSSFVFARPVELQYGRVADDVTPPPPPPAENLYAEISEKDERGRSVLLRTAAAARGGAADDYTLRLGSDGHSSSPSSPENTMESSSKC